MDHWRSHIPKNNPPKQFCEWSFEQGDRKWQQDEQEHEFELWSDFFWRKIEWMGAGISGGGPRGAHKVRGAPQGGGRALHPRGPHVAPPTYFFHLYIPTYPQTIRYEAKNLIPPPQPSVPTRSHLRACSGAPPEGASTMEGFYIITIAPPMKCE